MYFENNNLLCSCEIWLKANYIISHCFIVIELN